MSDSEYSVLFVCTANRIRSVIAEALFRQTLAKTGDTDKWAVGSAGTWAGDGLPPMSYAIDAMAARGVDVSGYRSTPIDSLNLADYQLILVMERGHKEALSVEFPTVADRVFLLSEMTNGRYEIDDPVSGSLRDHSHAIDVIEQIIETGYGRMQELAAESGGETGAP